MSRQSDLTKRVQEDLANRSMQGIWGQPCVLLLVFLTTNCVERAPTLMWTACALMAIQTALRLLLLKRMRVLYPRNPRLWEKSHLVLIMFCSGFWGFMGTFAICAYGYHDQNTLVFLLCHAGITLGMVTVLVHDTGLMKLALALLYTPQVSAQILLGADGRWGPTLTILAYLMYIAMQGKKLNQAYWRQVNDNYDLATIARRDYLTSLPNRLYMEEMLETSITNARQSGGKMALLYIDIDGFKQINDRFSHRVGDLFLREIAKRLTAGIRSDGIAARLGGDEFAILVTECASEQAAVAIAERVLRLAREPLSIEGNPLGVSASIGISFFPGDADISDHLVRAADQAMYVAKCSGKNQVRVFDSVRDLPGAPAETDARAPTPHGAPSMLRELSLASTSEIDAESVVA